MSVLIPMLFWGGAIFVAHKIGEPKGRAGWAWGVFLGWIGVIIVACLGPSNGAQHKSFQLTSNPATLQPAVPVPSQLPPAGWYDDPTTPGNVRYWDGAAWSTYSSAPEGV